ncbi:GNAT family N-acetyltransferase [Paenibacillus tarimensis]
MTVHTEYRTIGRDELDAAYRLERSCYPADAAATREAFRHRLRSYPDYFWSAWAEGRLVGIANGVLTNAEHCGDEAMKGTHDDSVNGRNLCVLTVAVEPDFRRHGIGSSLMQRLLAAAERDGLEKVILMCEPYLIPFYALLGFRHLGRSSSAHAGMEWHEMRLDFTSRC